MCLVWILPRIPAILTWFSLVSLVPVCRFLDNTSIRPQPLCQILSSSSTVLLFHSLWSKMVTTLWNKKPEGHSHHVCHIVTLFLITVPATTFKHIIFWTKLPLYFLWKCSLWQVIGTVHSFKAALAGRLSAFGLLSNVNSTVTEK
jgi:hypothetical protein